MLIITMYYKSIISITEIISLFQPFPISPRHSTRRATSRRASSPLQTTSTGASESELAELAGAPWLNSNNRKSGAKETKHRSKLLPPEGTTLRIDRTFLERPLLTLVIIVHAIWNGGFFHCFVGFHCAFFCLWNRVF